MKDRNIAPSAEAATSPLHDAAMRPRLLLLLGSACWLALAVALQAAAVPRLFPDIALGVPVGDPDAENPISNTEGPKTLAAGDFNGDGLADVVSGNLDGSLSVLLGRTNDYLLATQILTRATGLLSNSSLRAVVPGDFNRDGHLDIVVGDIARQGFVVLLGDGTGALTPLARTDLGPVRAMAAGDFNHDGKLDLLIACSPPDCEWCSTVDPSMMTNRFLCVLRGNGDGSFGAPQYLLTPGTPACFYDVEAADMDGDGHLDAVALDFARCYSSGPIARTRQLQIFKNDGAGGFATNAPNRILEPTGEGPRAFHVAWIDERVIGGTNPPGATLDLVVVNRDSGSINVFLNHGGLNFSAPISFYAGGGPRDVAVGDLDGDGYVDLIIVERFNNEISVRRGLGGGRFEEPIIRFPTGVSPRNIVLGDFNGDGVLDAAVNNRVSEDVSIFIGAHGVAGFLVSDSYYPAGITPVSVIAQDFNGDSYPDVATANLRSHDIRVRLNVGDGSLSNETIYPVNYQPAFLAAGDVNGDGRLDLVVTCLGQSGQGGSLVTLLGRGDGRFDPPLTTTFGNAGFRPYWLRLGDMDGDQVLDAVLGGIEGSLVASQGIGDGRFAPEVMLIRGWGRPLGIALGDFDEDGWLDVATSSGKIVMNDGLFFTPAGWQGRTRHFNAGTQAWAVEADDLDGDHHLDLMVALTFVRPDPIGVYFGSGDGSLTEPTIYAGPDVGVVALAAKDMDGDGIKDIVVGNRCAATVIIMRGLGHRAFEYREIVRAYSVEDVEIADMNKDGKPDIVGVGVGLWFSINGGTNRLVEPRTSVFYSIPERAGFFINELMALNTSYHVTNSASPDWIEIYNHNASTQSLAGWSLEQYTRDGATNRWTFPATNTAVLPPFGHLVVYCNNKPGTNLGLYANFELSSDGENVAILRPDGAREDFVTFPPMPEDVSYARTSDGARFLAYNPSPTLGAANQQPANLDPSAERKQPYVGPGATELGLNARMFDDVAVAYAAACYRLTGSSNDFVEIALSDDGAHGDKLAGDGYFGAILPSMSPGSEVEYYVRVVDLEGHTASAPNDFDDPSRLYHVKVPASAPALRLTELVAANNTGLRDERNQYEDWLEVWNCGNTPVDLTGYALSLDYFDHAVAWSFPGNRILQANERAVVFCDNDLFQGPLHASFKLLKSGDRVFLIQTNTWTIVDSLSFGAMPTDTSFGVIGHGTNANWLAWPTPGAENIPIPPRRYPASTMPEIFWRMTGGGQFIAMRWMGPPSGSVHVETSDDLRTWLPAGLTPTHLGEGLYQWTDIVDGPNRFYRVAMP